MRLQFITGTNGNYEINTECKNSDSNPAHVYMLKNV